MRISAEQCNERIEELLRTISEKDAEIERMTDQAVHFRDMAQKQGYLLTRAADALEGKPVYDAVENLKLIDELRKAAAE